MTQRDLKPYFRWLGDVIDVRLTILELSRSRLKAVGLDGLAAICADQYERHLRVRARLNGRKMFRGDFALRRRAAQLVRRGKL